MKLYIWIIILAVKKYIFRKPLGSILKSFCESMGIVYIKLAQILATQNIGELFTEEDRNILSGICDDVNPVDFGIIKKILEREYPDALDKVFTEIDSSPAGSASISQVHKTVLSSGETAAVKIKRTDITDGIEKDIARIRKLMHRFGRFIGFKNFIAGDKALDLYLDWIREETDFLHEKENIKLYGSFAESVNGKVSKTKKIRVPKVYEELCTENVIVMEFIDAKTINQMQMTEQNKIKIRDALNSYFQLSFYALLNDKKVVFHGDPHGGNIFIDDSGNIGFLDMGLIFELTDEDAAQTRDFFLAAYTEKHEKLFRLLSPYGEFSEETSAEFKRNLAEFCSKTKQMPITSYFIEMVNICFYCEIKPPNFLFCMSKAFVCLYGISVFTENMTETTELLKTQMIKFFIKRSAELTFDSVKSSISAIPKAIYSLTHRRVEGLSKDTDVFSDLRSELRKNLDSFTEMLSLL